jgi:two-component system response regulator (stage 0 sporulation protein F)
MTRSLLLVEDRPAISFALSDYFRSIGWYVECAATAAKAEVALRRRAFTLMIADLSLSEPRSTDGLELTARVRREWPATRTIILTAYGTPETERIAARIGVDAFLHKPAPLADLARLAAGLAGNVGDSPDPAQAWEG